MRSTTTLPAAGAGHGVAPAQAAAAAPPLLREWMDRYGPELRGHVGRMLGSDDDADDILQQVWLSVVRRPPELGAGSNPRAWLYRTATNAALDRLATDRRRRAALHGGEPRLLPDADPAPDARVLRLNARSRARIREHVARLPRKQREAVWLRWVEGDDYPKVAAKLGCSEQGARANVYQGLKRLRRELFDLWEEEYGA